MWQVFTQVQLRDVVDVTVITVLLYTIIVWVRRARVSRVLSGLATLTLIYFIATLLGLQLTVWAFQAVFAVIAIILIVIFQSELRQLFERLAWNFGGERAGPEESVTEPLIAAVSRLAAARVGALIVIPGTEPVERHVAGGIVLNGAFSGPLMESLFDPSSPGHDGAVVLEGSQISRFAVHLPLSTDFSQLGGRGTRHAAALGLAERSDALCIVVSEERGQIAVARDGRLHQMEGPLDLTAHLEQFVSEKTLAPPTRPRWHVPTLRRNWGEKALALSIALLAWTAFVSDFSLEIRSVNVAVTVENLPGDVGVLRIEPEQISVRFQGTRRSMAQLDTQEALVVLDSVSAAAGEQMLRITPDNVRAPAELEIVSIDPALVRLELVEP